MMQWQPIETAPKDGQYILCYGTVEHEDTNGPNVFTAQYTEKLTGVDDVDGHWQFAWFDGGYYGNCYPTHWMPLPEPPHAAP